MDSSSPFSIDKLTSYHESNQLEVKSAHGGLPNSLWETYSAFANSDGGIIVLGVKEKKDGSLVIEGVDNAPKLEKDFWNMVNNRQKVSCNILTNRMVNIENVDGKNVIIIHVPRAERTSRPVYVGLDPKLGSYRRNGDGDYHCTIEEVSLMLRDASLVSEDNKILKNKTASAFNHDTIKRYRRLFELHHYNHIWNDEEDEVFMRRVGAMREDSETGKFHPTGAGLLMFGNEHEIIDEFPQYFLDYQENRNQSLYNRWTDRVNSQSGEWSGNVLDFILIVVPKLQAELKVPFVLKGNQRDEDTPLHKIIREAMVNMVTNADFYGRRGVVVQKNATGFTFANPGSMRASVKEAVHSNISDPRNSVMLRMLSSIHYGERAGSGLQGIFKTWRAVYHIEPRMVVSTNGIDRTTLYLDYGSQQPDIDAMMKLYANPTRSIFKDNLALNEADVALNVVHKNDNVAQDEANVALNVVHKSNNVALTLDERIVNIIKANPNIKRDDIANQLSVTKKTIERHLKHLGISWNGHSKTGHWIFP